MSSSNLKNLVKAGQLKEEPFNEQEYNGLISLGRTRLQDALNEDLLAENRFLLAYDAAHSFALAALRKHGYRSINRYIVFQVLTNTLGVGQDLWRVLDVCHNRRNIAEYQGHLEFDNQLLEELLKAAKTLSDLLG
jgi:hypothetical protein